MPGAKIPVLEIEKFTITTGGRGLYIEDDAANFDVDTWSTGISGGTTGAKQFLPAASATAWWRVTDDSANVYYVPLFNYHW